MSRSARSSASLLSRCAHTSLTLACTGLEESELMCRPLQMGEDEADRRVPAVVRDCVDVLLDQGALVSLVYSQSSTNAFPSARSQALNPSASSAARPRLHTSHISEAPTTEAIPSPSRPFQMLRTSPHRSSSSTCASSRRRSSREATSGTSRAPAQLATTTLLSLTSRPSSSLSFDTSSALSQPSPPSRTSTS